MMRNSSFHPSSFRDPSGFIFYSDNIVYRQINMIYKEDYEYFIKSGLYDTLVNANLLIPHQEVEDKFIIIDNMYKVIKPEPIPFISYPYEWCFSQLKDAALTTLKIQKKAIDYGMSLKDCSAYNIQFRNGVPIFIDTLSFEKLVEIKPWVGYRQFCQHFLAPLALMSYRDIRLNQLLRIYIDGIPLDLASKLLPISSYFSISLLTHIHLHAKSQKYFSNKELNKNSLKISHKSLLGILDSLETVINRLNWKTKESEWANYYDNTNYSLESFQQKKIIIAEFLENINPKNVFDLGANIGLFSRISNDMDIFTVSCDIDPCAVEKNYKECIKRNDKHILPLLIDITNPSPAIGWQNNERTSFLTRGSVDTVIALALIHHLAIGNNIPLSSISNFFKTICNKLIIEFVPKNDSQVQRLLVSRCDIFVDYTKDIFENEFKKYFIINRCVKIKGSERVLYLMSIRSNMT